MCLKAVKSLVRRKLCLGSKKKTLTEFAIICLLLDMFHCLDIEIIYTLMKFVHISNPLQLCIPFKNCLIFLISFFFSNFVVLFWLNVKGY